MATSSAEELKKIKKHFERRIKIMLSVDEADDDVAAKIGGIQPLELWWRYILWAQKQGTPKFVEDLCKRCLECFNEKPELLKDEDVESDERFAKIWLKIASSNLDDPAPIYKHMYRSKIATKVGLFYVNWASHSKQTENDEFAVKILKSGLKKNCEPKQALLDLLAKWAPNEAATEGTEEEGAKADQKRQNDEPYQQQPPPEPPSIASVPASSAKGNTIAKYRKAEVYPQGDVDLNPDGFERSLEEIRFSRWRKEKQKISSEHAAQINELQQLIKESDYRAAQMEARLHDAESRAEKERKERTKLKATYESKVAELERAMTNHVEEIVKNHEELMAAKDDELRRLNNAMGQLKEEFEATVKSKEPVASFAEKRDHASAMLTPKGPAAKRQSSGFGLGATVMPSPTINSKMAQAQVLALFNQTMKFGGSEPSIGSAEPSLIAPPPAKTPASVFQIFRDDDKENDVSSQLAPFAPAAPAPFDIFKDPTEKINIPKNVTGGGKGILKTTSAQPQGQVLFENTVENVFNDDPRGRKQQRPLASQQPESTPEMSIEDQLGDITSFNPPESSTVNVASILKSQGVKSTWQLYQNQEPTVKFTVPSKQLRQLPQLEEDESPNAVVGDPFGGVTEFVPQSCSTKNWQALAKVAQKNVVLDASAIAPVIDDDISRQMPQSNQFQQRFSKQEQQQPSLDPPPPPPISQGLLDVAEDYPHENPRPMSPLYEVSKEFSQISVGSNRTRCSSSSSSSSSSSAINTLSKSGGGCLSQHHSTRGGGRLTDMENLQEEDEEQEEKEHQQKSILATRTPGGLGRLNRTDAHTTMNADERSHALLPPTTPRAVPPSNLSRHSAFQPFIDDQPIPWRSFGGADLPLITDEVPIGIPDPLIDEDDLDRLLRGSDDEDGESIGMANPTRNDLSVLFDAAPMPNVEDSDRNHDDDTADVMMIGVAEPMPDDDDTHARDYAAATFNLNQTVAIEDRIPDHECTIMIDPEDPWKPKLIANFLSRATIPLNDREGFVETPQNFALTSLKVGKSYQLGGPGEQFLVQKQIGEGGFGRVFLADWVGRGKTVCLKFQKPPCPWEFYVSSEIHRRLRGGGAAASALEREEFMRIEKAYFSASSSIFVNSIGKGTLLDLVNTFKTNNWAMGEELLLLFSLDILEVIDRLHSCKIIHADVKPDNFLFCGPLPDPASLKADLMALSAGLASRRPLGANASSSSSSRRPSTVKLIDFGRCIDMTLFREGTDFMAKVKTEGFQCKEMVEGKPWTYQIDLFGVMATIHVLLKGEYPRWKREALGGVIFPPLGIGSGNLRGFRHRDLWNELATTLVGIADCESIPPLKPLIRKVADTLTKNLDAYEKKYRRYEEVLKLGGLA